MAQMNWLAVVVAAISGFLIINLWYGPLFGRAWRRVAGIHDNNINLPPAPVFYGTALAFSFLAASVVGHLLSNFPGRPLTDYLLMAAGIGIGFVFPALGMRQLYARKNSRVLMIDTAGWTIFYLVMGAVFALFG